MMEQELCVSLVFGHHSDCVTQACVKWEAEFSFSLFWGSDYQCLIVLIAGSGVHYNSFYLKILIR
jgi:hypothetical protein